MNPVNITCPNCGHEGGTAYIEYKPMAVMANSACFEDSDGRQLARAGQVTCEECNEDFLYRLVVEVACEVALPPEYFNPDRETTPEDIQRALRIKLGPAERFGEEL